MSEQAAVRLTDPGLPPLLDDRVAEGGRPGQAQVFVSVGTDTHPFDRLVDWMDGWLAGLRQDGPNAVRCLVTIQYGTSRQPAAAAGSPLMEHAALLASMGQACAIVTHGGPATIRDARSVGLLPLVVPRDPRFGEHVDDHQIRFTHMLAEKGDIVLCRGREELVSALDRAVVDNAWLRLPDASRSVETATSIARVGAILDDVVREGQARRSAGRPSRPTLFRRRVRSRGAR